MPRFETEPTPNPNSLKITTDAGLFIDAGMEAFSSAAGAGDHPLGKPLFTIAGVVNVFILPQFLTVSKSPDSRWNQILPEVNRVLEAYFSART